MLSLAINGFKEPPLKAMNIYIYFIKIPLISITVFITTYMILYFQPYFKNTISLLDILSLSIFIILIIAPILVFLILNKEEKKFIFINLKKRNKEDNYDNK